MGAVRVSLLIWSSCWLLACSVLVAPESITGERCEVGEGDDDPCAAKGLGWHCGLSGTCEPCESSVEVCDQQDNDCDMKTDEGLEEVPETCDGDDNDCDGLVDEGHDADGDGVTWCGAGTLLERDCDDADRAVYPARTYMGEVQPGAFEACDGKDNNCDQRTDEPDTTGQREDCIQRNCEEFPCTGDLRCDPVSKRCLAQRSVGSRCASDFECGAGFCVAARMVGLQEELGDERVCATACCSDADCPRDVACVVYRGGIRVCLPSLISDRRAGGERCGDPTQCASGVCDNWTCKSPCATAGDCDRGQTCSLSGGATFGNPDAWACGSRIGGQAAGSACFSLLQEVCASGVCEAETSRCAQPCGVDADCPAGSRCDFRVARSAFGEAWLPVCVDEVRAVTAETCCTSADCGTGARCVPVTDGTQTAMRCQVGPS